jgi:hypothetical protein
MQAGPSEEFAPNATGLRKHYLVRMLGADHVQKSTRYDADATSDTEFSVQGGVRRS